MNICKSNVKRFNECIGILDDNYKKAIELNLDRKENAVKFKNSPNTAVGGRRTKRRKSRMRQSIKKMRIEYNSLPEANTKEVEIISAKYGTEDKNVDVTDKVVDLYLAKENIKSCNKLGGDPCPGVVKVLTVQYIYGEAILEKVFSEGSVVKF